MRTTRMLGLAAVVTLLAAACARTPDVIVQPPQVSVQTASEGDGEVAGGIAVTGVGEVTGTPDTLTMTFGVSVVRTSVAEAVAVAAGKAEAVLAALRDQGVADDDLRTVDFSIFPEYDYRGGRERIIGYRVTNSVVAKVRDLDRAGEVIDAAIGAGGDDVRVSGVAFSIEDDHELVAAARDAAFADARAKAEQLARLAGVTLGPPISITESFTVPGPIPYYVRTEMVAADVATPIEPGTQKVAVTVSVRFSIEP